MPRKKKEGVLINAVKGNSNVRIEKPEVKKVREEDKYNIYAKKS